MMHVEGKMAAAGNVQPVHFNSLYINSKYDEEGK